MWTLEPVACPRHFALTLERFDAWIHVSEAISEQDVLALCEKHQWTTAYVLFHHCTPTFLSSHRLFVGQIQTPDFLSMPATPVELEVIQISPGRFEEFEFPHQIRLLCREDTSPGEVRRFILGSAWSPHVWRLILADTHGIPLPDSHSLVQTAYALSISTPLLCTPDARADSGFEFWASQTPQVLDT
jgi:hypothetical protein